MSEEIKNIMARLQVLLVSAEQAADFISITETFIDTLKSGETPSTVPLQAPESPVRGK